MKDLLQYMLDGLSIGSVYALVALGLVVVYRGTGQINFAQGEMALFSTLVTWWLHDKGVPLLFAMAISAALAFIGGALIEVGLMRPAGRRSAFAPVVIAIGLFQGLNSLSGILFPRSGQGLPFPSLFPNDPDDFVSILGAAWRVERIGVFVVVLA
ncbi:MAG: branched-chain amino acid ABC transporter permease, partial [Ilumatobacteraceae bacterium]